MVSTMSVDLGRSLPWIKGVPCVITGWMNPLSSDVTYLFKVAHMLAGTQGWKAKSEGLKIREYFSFVFVYAVSHENAYEFMYLFIRFI